MGNQLRSNFLLECPKPVKLNWTWFSNDRDGLEGNLCAETGLTKTVYLPKPNQRYRAKTLNLGHGLKAELKWSTMKRRGVRLVTLTVTAGPYRFVAVEDPCNGSRWLGYPLKDEGGKVEGFNREFAERFALRP